MPSSKNAAPVGATPETTPSHTALLLWEARPRGEAAHRAALLLKASPRVGPPTQAKQQPCSNQSSPAPTCSCGRRAPRRKQPTGLPCFKKTSPRGRASHTSQAAAVLESVHPPRSCGRRAPAAKAAHRAALLLKSFAPGSGLPHKPGSSGARSVRPPRSCRRRAPAAKAAHRAALLLKSVAPGRASHTSQAAAVLDQSTPRALVGGAPRGESNRRLVI